MVRGNDHKQSNIFILHGNQGAREIQLPLESYWDNWGGGMHQLKYSISGHSSCEQLWTLRGVTQPAMLKSPSWGFAAFQVTRHSRRFPQRRSFVATRMRWERLDREFPMVRHRQSSCFCCTILIVNKSPEYSSTTPRCFLFDALHFNYIFLHHVSSCALSCWWSSVLIGHIFSWNHCLDNQRNSME